MPGIGIISNPHSRRNRRYPEQMRRLAYVLGKDDSSPTDTLTYEADCGEIPRDGAVETVNIPNLALIQDDPPYTLYRITLSNNAAEWGSSDFFKREELAYDIGSLQFRYYDGTDTQLNAGFDPSTTSDDIGGTDSMAGQRARIRRVGFDLLGLARDPDPGWVDRGDFSATREYRKMELTHEIRIANAGVEETDDDYSIPSTFTSPP